MTIVESTFLSGAELLEVIDEYRNAVAEKHYEPVDYKTYCALRTALKSRTSGYFDIYRIDYATISIQYLSNILYSGAVSGFDLASYLDIHLNDKFKRETVEAEIPTVNNTNTTENKENNAMNKMFNFEFGSVDSATVRMSIYGMAIKNTAGIWVSYNPATEEIMDVDVFNFNSANMLFKMPVAIKDIAAGDVIIHNRAPMFVTGIAADGKALVAVDPIHGDRKEIMLTKSPFGFNFATKVVNFMGNLFGGTPATAENPFGNMWMLMALSNENKGSMSDMMMAMAMASMAGNANGAMNPMSMMAMAMMMDKNKDGKDNDMVNMMMAMAMANNMPMFGGMPTPAALPAPALTPASNENE